MFKPRVMLGIGKPVMTKTGANDTSGVVWALCKCSFFFSFFFVLTNVLGFY